MDRPSREPNPPLDCDRFPTGEFSRRRMSGVGRPGLDTTHRRNESTDRESQPRAVKLSGVEATRDPRPPMCRGVKILTAAGSEQTGLFSPHRGRRPSQPVLSVDGRGRGVEMESFVEDRVASHSQSRNYRVVTSTLLERAGRGLHIRRRVDHRAEAWQSAQNQKIRGASRDRA